MAMKAKMISVTPRQDVFLEEEAKRVGISSAEVIRRIIDAYMDRAK